MPKQNINYSKTYFYKIVCRDLSVNGLYIGHTTHFTKRKYTHKCNCNNLSGSKYNYEICSFIRQNGNWDNFDMIQIEECSLTNKREAEKREREIYEMLGANLNMRKPFLTSQEQTIYHNEYNKAYRNKNEQYFKD